MDHRGNVHLLIWWLLPFLTCLSAEKLSPDQKAPLFARGSGGLILKPPFEEEQRAAASPPTATNVVSEDGVEREEIATLKLVEGELVRVVEGHFSYKSPEGIPVSVQYVADENGYRASFRLGTAVTGGSGSRINLGDRSGVGPGHDSSRPSGPSKPGDSGYLPPTSNADRSYLPPQ